MTNNRTATFLATWSAHFIYPYHNTECSGPVCAHPTMAVNRVYEELLKYHATFKSFPRDPPITYWIGSSAIREANLHPDNWYRFISHLFEGEAYAQLKQHAEEHYQIQGELCAFVVFADTPQGSFSAHPPYEAKTRAVLQQEPYRQSPPFWNKSTTEYNVHRASQMAAEVNTCVVVVGKQKTEDGQTKLGSFVILWDHYFDIARAAHEPGSKAEQVDKHLKASWWETVENQIPQCHPLVMRESRKDKQKKKAKDKEARRVKPIMLSCDTCQYIHLIANVDASTFEDLLAESSRSKNLHVIGSLSAHSDPEYQTDFPFDFQETRLVLKQKPVEGVEFVLNPEIDGVLTASLLQKYLQALDIALPDVFPNVSDEEDDTDNSDDDDDADNSDDSAKNDGDNDDTSSSSSGSSSSSSESASSSTNSGSSHDVQSPQQHVRAKALKDNKVPAKPTEALVDEEVPAEQTEAPANEGVPAKPTEAPADEGVPAEPTEAPADEAVPAKPTEAPADEGVPAKPIEAPANEGGPAGQTGAPADEEVPAGQTGAPADEKVPAEQTEAPVDEDVPAEQTEAPVDEDVREPAHASQADLQVNVALSAGEALQQGKRKFTSEEETPVAKRVKRELSKEEAQPFKYMTGLLEAAKCDKYFDHHQKRRYKDGAWKINKHDIDIERNYRDFLMDVYAAGVDMYKDNV